MNTEYRNIVIKIREAAQIAAETTQHPEARLRELVLCCWLPKDYGEE